VFTFFPVLTYTPSVYMQVILSSQSPSLLNKTSTIVPLCTHRIETYQCQEHRETWSHLDSVGEKHVHTVCNMCQRRTLFLCSKSPSLMCSMCIIIVYRVRVEHFKLYVQVEVVYDTCYKGDVLGDAMLHRGGWPQPRPPP